MSTTNNDSQTVQQVPQKGDKVEVVKILILAVISFVLGFGLVIFFLSPDDGPRESVQASASTPEDELAPSAAATPSANDEQKEDESAGYAPPNADENPLMAGLKENGDNGQGDDDLHAEADAPADVPPGKTPDGVALDGKAFYLKCWNSEGGETPGSGCDPLTVLEKRFSTRLYVVDKCKQAHAGPKAEGKLSIGVEINFSDNSLSFWNGASSTLENAAKVATCLRKELNGLPTHSVNHKFERYRLFFTVIFGKSGAASPAVATKAEEAKTPTKNLPKGKMVDVVKDRVRVRKSPVDGDIIGKISSGNQVKLLNKKGDWCRVVTPNENEGWMICEALSK